MTQKYSPRIVPAGVGKVAQLVYSKCSPERNTGAAGVQLIARHWFITDGEGEVQEVKGLGVVGQQPLLRSGEHFEYTSWATLPTPAGTMRGEYFCVTEDAQFFQANIPEFALVMPRTLH